MQPAALRHLQTQVFIDLSVKFHAYILFDARVIVFRQVDEKALICVLLKYHFPWITKI